MEWMKIIGDSVQFIEEHLTEDLSVNEIAKAVNVSPFYFQKGFAMLCGFSVSEYIRNRRLALAGRDLTTTNEKVIEIALKYGYDSPDSFAKAFTRFHGVTPMAARRNNVMLKSFAPLKIKFTLEGGYLMDYKIMHKDAFTVLANAKTFPYEGAKTLCPQFWQEHFASGKGKIVMGTYGINIDPAMGHDTFEYLIADPCKPEQVSTGGFRCLDDSCFYMGGVPLCGRDAECVAGCQYPYFLRVASGHQRLRVCRRLLRRVL